MDASAQQPSAPTAADVAAQLNRRYRQVLDKTVVYPLYRWLGLLALLLLYGFRVWRLQGWFIVTYGLGIFLLNLFIGFISPQVDPETEGPVLPTKNAEAAEFKPFSRKLPEFKAWESAMRGICLAFALTLTKLFDIPVFWPILVIYFLALLFLTLKDRVAHMYKHRYVPFSRGKKSYKGAGVAGGGAKKAGGVLGMMGGGGGSSGGGGGSSSGGNAEAMFRGGLHTTR